MILLYRILTRVTYPLLFILIFFRMTLKKEDPIRYKEKIFSSSFNVKKNNNKKLIWFHAASVGELKSIVPIIKNLNLSLKDFEFLVTTNTLSSSKIAKLEFKNFSNVLHRFLPYDVDFLINKFLKLWQPNYLFLVDSEIWPNIILKSKSFGIPIALINARITSKSFKRWMLFPKTAIKIFSSFDLCLTANQETKAFLKRFNAKNVYSNGNIKLIDQIDENKISNNNEKFLLNNNFWIGASTHSGEEELCLKTHLLLKENKKNLFTIIAPRHIQRSQKIKSLCDKFKLSSQILNDGELINPNNEIIILNSFGVLQTYFKYAKSVFIGKSTIKKLENDSGQNPLEAAKLRCKIYHGPYVYNFSDIYEILKNNKISFVINNYNELSNYLKNDFELQNKDKSKTSEIIKELGNKTLVDTLKNINRFMFNESN